MRKSWPVFIVVTVALILVLHALAFFPHEYAHSFSAWLLGWKANPLALNYGHLTPGNILLQFDIDENVEYDPIFAAGHGGVAGFIAAAGMVIGNGLVSYPISLWGYSAASRRGARGWALFFYWLCVCSVGNFIDYVPVRVFATHGDMYLLAKGFGCSPGWIMVVLGIPIAIALGHFLFWFAPRALRWLFPESAGRRGVTMVLSMLFLFGFYGAVGLSGYGTEAHAMSFVSVCVLLPVAVILGCWRMVRPKMVVAGLVMLLGVGRAQGQGPVVATKPVVAANPVVPDKVNDKLVACNNVALGGLLDERMRINLEKRLLIIDSATLLSGFEHRPGAQVWIGEHVGKFLYSASNVWRYTHDARLKALADAMEKTYVQTQLPDGYLGTYLPSAYWTEWDVWAHKYAIVGLLGYYQITGDRKALETAEKAGDLICRVFGPGKAQRDINNSGWHAGLASGSILGPMIDLYRYTGKPEYLHFARYILSAWEGPTGPKIMSVLQKWGRVDKIGDAKAYEMLSCFVGILQYYRLTGEGKYLQAMETAWQDIVANRLYVTGTSSSFEVFQGNHKLPGANKDDIGEGCVTVTWMQFNAQLLALTAQMRYAEELEKSVYNHLLAAEDPLTGCVSYYTPITGVKPYKCDQGYSCCLSSIPGGISMIPSLAYGRSRSGLWVLLYEQGAVSDTVLDIDGGRLVVRLDCQTDFPREGRLVYRVHVSRPGYFGINFRVPSWAADFSATVNGRMPESVRGILVGIQRQWEDGDSIVVNMQLPLRRLAGGPSFPGRVAYKRGPQVLAEDSVLTAIIGPARSGDGGRDSAGVSDLSALLPKNWSGTQAYGVGGGFVLTPFADAGQLSGPITIWLPNKR
jgi:DUF1680 family protein